MVLARDRSLAVCGGPRHAVAAAAAGGAAAFRGRPGAVPAARPFRSGVPRGQTALFCAVLPALAFGVAPDQAL